MGSDGEFTHVDVADLVATVTLRRPPVNALHAAVATLTADGDRVFCAGADIGEYG